MSVFGPIVTGEQVEQATVAQLQLWLPTYIAELERQTGRAAGSVQPPRSYLISSRFERRPEDQIPACIVVSPGTASQPERRGDGTLSAWWRIEVGIAAAASTRENANQLAKLYAAAIRTLLLQKPSLGGITNAVTIVGESYDDMPTNILDVGAYALVLADVQVDEYTTSDGGPTVPDIHPADWPVIATTHVIFRKEPIA